MTKLSGSEKLTRNFLVFLIPQELHSTTRNDEAAGCKQACELGAWIHYVFTRPDALRELRGKLERFTRKKGFSSPNHRLSQDMGTQVVNVQLS